MEKKLEIIMKDIKYPRITVTPTRVTLKFPTTYPEGYPPIDNVKKIFLAIAKQLENETQSLRGSFRIPASLNPIEVDHYFIAMQPNEHRTAKGTKAFVIVGDNVELLPPKEDYNEDK